MDDHADGDRDDEDDDDDDDDDDDNDIVMKTPPLPKGRKWGAVEPL